MPRRHRSPFARRAVLAVGLALALVVGLAAGVARARSASVPNAAIPAKVRPLSAASAASNSATFTDPNGDGALDVTTVLVANDNQPNVHFDVNLGTALQTSTDIIVVYLDTDNNGSTGGASAGAEYAVFADFADNSLSLGKWDGSQFSEVSSPTLKIVYSSNHVGIDIQAVDLGGVKSFNFWIGAFRSGTELDRAPDTASWHYDILVGSTSPPPPPPPPVETLKVKSFGKDPWPPRAGESFVLILDVVDAKTGKAVYAGVRCSGKLGGRSFPGTDFARRGESFCEWNLPESAVGKFFAGTIQVFGGGGSSVKRSFSATVVRPPRRLDIYHVSPSPSSPRSGSVFYTAFRVQILEPGQPVRQFDPTGKGACRGTISGHPQHVVSSQWYGKGWLCEWQIPSGTRGQAFLASVQVTWHGLKATKSVRYTIQ